MASLTIEQITGYFANYIRAYRQEYRLFVTSAPSGGGYPPLRVSPYLDSRHLRCLIADDGYAVIDQSQEPAYQWEILGGPALVTDYPESRTPAHIIDHLREEGVLGKHIGLYRIVAKSGMPEEIWRGDLGQPVAKTVESSDVHFSVEQYEIPWLSLMQRLTFGAYGLILNVGLPDKSSYFWRPHITRDVGFVPADRNNKRFINYLELCPHVEPAAWDLRSIPTRIAVDLRRDFAYAFAMQIRGSGGTIALGAPNLWVEHFHNRLLILSDTMTRFATLLADRSDADESVFHGFLQDNPIILDVYGEIISKPRFVYPAGESPLGKEYVEPDFIVRYPNNSYKLIEIERPSKNLATARGESRSGVTQAAFQVGEWKTFIQKHYDQIKDSFPGISVSHQTMIVISRATETSAGRGRNVREYLELVKNQVRADEVFTYDDLLQRAASAYARLAALVPS